MSAGFMVVEPIIDIEATENGWKVTAQADGHPFVATLKRCTYGVPHRTGKTGPCVDGDWHDEQLPKFFRDLLKTYR